eukprot:11140365-Alexandrium_andersonii.AAC.1
MTAWTTVTGSLARCSQSAAAWKARGSRTRKVAGRPGVGARAEERSATSAGSGGKPSEGTSGRPRKA